MPTTSSCHLDKTSNRNKLRGMQASWQVGMQAGVGSECSVTIPGALHTYSLRKHLMPLFYRREITQRGSELSISASMARVPKLGL